MSIIATNEEPESPSFTLLGLIETMIRTYNLNEAERKRFTGLLEGCDTQEKALEIVGLMRDYKPIMGLEKLPTNAGEAAEATRLRVERENFKERK
jgi:hypothetical protein